MDYLLSIGKLRYIERLSMYSRFSRFLTVCSACGNKTSRKFAREHGGQCKACATGIETVKDNGLTCPDCGQATLTPYQRSKGYHCNNCTRNTDPIGYALEMSTPYEPDRF